MNAFLLIVPIFIVRYAYVALRAKQKLKLLNYFPAPKGVEKHGKTVYLIINTYLLFAPLFMEFSVGNEISIPGCTFYGLGLIMYIKAIHDFISVDGLVMHGIYSFSRNPQALSFILIYTGISMLTNSILYMSLVCVLVWAFNEMAKSEERFCKLEFGDPYILYTKFTRRFL